MPTGGGGRQDRKGRAAVIGVRRSQGVEQFRAGIEGNDRLEGHFGTIRKAAHLGQRVRIVRIDQRNVARRVRIDLVWRQAEFGAKGIEIGVEIGDD